MLLTTESRHQLEACHREYALGLNKFEPGDIKALRLPIPEVANITRAMYRSAIKVATAGEIEKASRIADEHAPCS